MLLLSVLMDSSAVGSLLVRSRPTTVVVTPTPTEIVPYKIPSGIIAYVLANRYIGEGHPGEHLQYLSQLCYLFKLAGVTMEFIMKKLFSVSLKDKASDWYKVLNNSDLLEWPELMSLFYAKFYPLREIHQDRNYIYNFWSRDGESIAQAWGRLKSLMLKCPIHEIPKEIILTNFYARLSRQDKEMMDVRPDMLYCSRSRCFHTDPGTKHISVPPRHMTKSYAPDFQHDITTLQIQGYSISYNRHTTALNTIHQRKIHV